MMRKKIFFSKNMSRTADLVQIILISLFFSMPPLKKSFGSLKNKHMAIFKSLTFLKATPDSMYD
jgi:hypothetical protein